MFFFIWENFFPSVRRSVKVEDIIMSGLIRQMILIKRQEV